MALVENPEVLRADIENEAPPGYEDIRNKIGRVNAVDLDVNIKKTAEEDFINQCEFCNEINGSLFYRSK